MSIKTMSQVWEQTHVKGTDKLALLALADYANDDGFCFPSYGSFATKVGVKPRQAMRVIAKLEAMGEVWVIEKPGHRNYYIVLTGQDRNGIGHRLMQCGQMPKEQVPAAVELVMQRRRGVMHDTPVMDDRSGGVMHDRSGVSSMTPKPSKNHQLEPSLEREAANDAPPAPQQSKIDSPVKAAVTTPPPVAPAPPKKAVHPFVEIYRETFHRYPSKPAIALIVERIGARRDSDQWRRVCETWLLSGYKPTNVQGMIEWLQRGIPQGKSKSRARSAAAPPATEYRPRTQAEIDAYLANAPEME